LNKEGPDGPTSCLRSTRWWYKLQTLKRTESYNTTFNNYKKDPNKKNKKAIRSYTIELALELRVMAAYIVAGT
jgi:hypothetical protein